MDALIRFLSSTRLAVFLCLVLAAEGIAGSLLYQGNTAVDRQFGAFALFRSPLFLAPSGILLLNILVCAGRRLASMTIRSPRTVTFLGIHAGLLLLAAGLLADGLLGFVGTKQYFVGVPGTEFFNWRTNREESFPFTLTVLDAQVRYHPLNLRIGVRDRSGGKVGLHEVREGISFRAGDPPITVTPRRFDIGTKTLYFDAEAQGKTVHAAASRDSESGPIGGYTVTPVAYADPEPSDHVARVLFSLPDGRREEKEIRINHPVSLDGKSFCIVEMGEDPYRNRYVGLQITREPGEPVFWAGALLFGVSLLAHLYNRRTVAAPVPADGNGEKIPAPPEGSSRKEEVAGAAGKRTAVVASVLLPLVLAAWPAEGKGIGRAIQGEETWEGEVRVVEPVTVEKGGTLRILAGTTVLLSGEDRDGDGCRDGYIQAVGKLHVSGEADRPVIFRRLDSGKAWQEVFLLDAEGVIRHAVFEGGLWGLHVHDGNVTVERTIFRGNEGGARLKGSGASFIRCSFRGNGIGLRFRDGGPVVASSVISGNGTGIFYREGPGGGRITGNIIANREWDLKIGDWATGDLDAAGNYWGGDGAARLVRDFRENRAGGKVTIFPSLSSPPTPCGADGGEGR